MTGVKGGVLAANIVVYNVALIIYQYYVYVRKFIHCMVAVCSCFKLEKRNQKTPGPDNIFKFWRGLIATAKPFLKPVEYLHPNADC